MKVTEVNSFESLPRPEAMSQIVWIDLDFGGERKRLAVIGCTLLNLKVTDSKHFGSPVKCLHINGTQVENMELPRKAYGRFFVVPIIFVTYIGMGPEFEVTTQGIPDTFVLIPNPPSGSPKKMKLKAIKANLGEFR